MFEPLEPRSRRRAIRPGCLSMAGGPLFGFGLWLVATAVLIRPAGVSARALILAGSVLALAGLAVLLVRMRRTIDAIVPTPELALAKGQRLSPGAQVPLRLGVRGPARLARLKVALVSERRWQEHVLTPGSAASTADRVEILSANDLLDETNVAIERRRVLERTLSLAVPYLGKPSGPTLPSGRVVWYLDAYVEARVGKPVHDVFDLDVVLSDAAGAAAQPAGAVAGPEPVSDASVLSRITPGMGCAVISLGLLLAGPLLLYLYFSGAATKRGNPVMGLMMGIVFSLAGLVGAWILVSLRRQERRPPPS